MASLSGVWGRSRVAVSSRGFCLVGSPACARFGILIRTHSQRETWVGLRPTPHGFAYCESSSERWVGSPESQYLSSRPPSVVTWDCVSPLSPARLSRAPRPDCNSPPRTLPGVSPSRRKACLSRCSFIARNPHNHAHTTSPVLTLSGHTFSG